MTDLRPTRNENAHRLTRNRAEALAGEIHHFWLKRGYAVDVWCEPLNTGDHEWVVRSSLAFSATPSRPR